MNLKKCNDINDLIRLSAKNYKIYVDLDGVLANFNKHFKELSGGVSPEVYDEEYGKDAFWELIEKEDPHFFYNLEWVPDGRELWDFVKNFNPTLLSTPSKSMKTSKPDKRKWVNEQMGEYIPLIFSFQKQQYADPTSILIDDMSKNIEKWREAGGIGIKHVDAPTTIHELKEILA